MGKEILLYFGSWQPWTERWGVGWAGMPIQRPNLPGDSQGARAFIDRVRGLLHGAITWRNSIVSSDSHLEIGHAVV